MERKVSLLTSVVRVKTLSGAHWERTRWLCFFTLSVPLLLTGCSWLRSEQPAPPSVPSQWQFAASEKAQATSPVRVRFWHSLGDPVLPSILAQALLDNNDLKLAGLQLKLAQVQSALVATTAWPEVSLGGSASQLRNLTAQGAYPPTTTSSAGLSAAVNYQVDLWGGQAAQQDAAEANAQASEADWHTARLSLQVSVAQLWWQLGYLKRVLSNAQADLDEARTVLALAHVRYSAGATSGTDMILARQALWAQEAAFTQSKQQLVETRTAFALLMGVLPETPFSELGDLSDTPLAPPDTGLPADLLARRSDVHAAELRVRSYLAAADATKLSFYPALVLTGSLGTASQTLTNYLANPVAGLSALLSLPFIQFNTVRLNTQGARLSYDVAVVTFRKALYTALKETEDALSARQQLIIQAQYLRQYVVYSREAERLSHVRWQVGGTDIQPWLDAQSARRQAELALLQNTLMRKQNAVQLYAALGGDYQGVMNTR